MIGVRDCHSELCVADIVPSCLSGRRSCRGLHIRAAFPVTAAAAALHVASSRRRTRSETRSRANNLLFSHNLYYT